ncbi:MAG: TIGR03756 family integrating conjugative element protein [Gammaproteobacteria bacterium]|nr:TIGR03756 family integrating conjugative element protein [Gammaproteobacteria bacterium]
MLIFISCAAVAEVDTFKITRDVVDAALRHPFPSDKSFLNYKIEGMCFWKHKEHGIPHFSSTLKVNEFLPDAVVSVYDNLGSNPWKYANKFIDPLAKDVGDQIYELKDDVKPNSTDYEVGSTKNMMEKFKEVDVIGDPALVTLFVTLGFMLIPSKADAYNLYYSSMADSYLWRNPLLDDITHPQDLLPNVRTEGSSIDEWGSIFPRIGYINQLGDYKAAAVLALRAADIATNSDQSHVYHYLKSGGCGDHCTVWASHENDFNDVKFQEIYPVRQKDAEKNFGINDLDALTAYNQDQLDKGDGNYLWVMWRHYEGCIQGDGDYIGEVTW